MPGSSDAGWEPLFWSVFEVSANPVVLVDQDRVIVDVNATGCELVGVPRDAMIGMLVDQFVAPHERTAVAAGWRELWATDMWYGERDLIAADSSHVHVEYAARIGEIGGRQVAVLVGMAVGPLEHESEAAPAVQLGELTPREREVLSLVALGNTSSEIAELLVISNDTVRTHVRNAMAKTGARTRAQLVAMALADRLLVSGG